MSVDPVVSVILNCTVGVCGAVAAVAIPADLLSPQTAVTVLWAVGMVGTVANALLHSLSSPKSGPLVKEP